MNMKLVLCLTLLGNIIPLPCMEQAAPEIKMLERQEEQALKTQSKSGSQKVFEKLNTDIKEHLAIAARQETETNQQHEQSITQQIATLKQRKKELAITQANHQEMFEHLQQEINRALNIEKQENTKTLYSIQKMVTGMKLGYCPAQDHQHKKFRAQRKIMLDLITEAIHTIDPHPLEPEDSESDETSSSESSGEDVY